MLVLIVDDSPLAGKILEEILKSKDHTTITVENGREGLKCLASMPDFDLVISDVEMPEMDGLSFLAEVRRHVEWEDLPFILSSGHADAATVQKAAALGCKHYLIKPHDAGQVLQKVLDATSQEVSILLKKSFMINRIGIKSEVYDELLVGFIREIEETLAIIEHSLNMDESTLAITAILKIQESATLLGADRLAKQFEKIPKNNKEEKHAQVKRRQPAFLREMKVLHQVLLSQPVLSI